MKHRRTIGLKEIEIAIAWVLGEIGIYEATEALYMDTQHTTGAYAIMARALKVACKTGRIRSSKAIHVRTKSETNSEPKDARAGPRPGHV